MEISNSSVFLVQYSGEDEQNKLLGIYNNEAAALSHKYDSTVQYQYHGGIYVTEVGVRTNKSLRPIYERPVICK